MQIVFSKNSSFASWLIRTFTDSDVSHVSLRFGGDESNWMVDSSGKHGGVKPGWWPSFVKRNKIVCIYEVSSDREREIEDLIDRVLDQSIDVRYDYAALVGFAIKIIVKKVSGKIIRNFLGSRKALFCSEFILKLSQKIEEYLGFVIYKGELEDVTPEDLKDQSKVNLYLKEVLFEQNPNFRELPIEVV